MSDLVVQLYNCAAICSQMLCILTHCLLFLNKLCRDFKLKHMQAMGQYALK